VGDEALEPNPLWRFVMEEKSEAPRKAIGKQNKFGMMLHANYGSEEILKY
jgi:hypothetical protein